MQEAVAAGLISFVATALLNGNFIIAELFHVWRIVEHFDVELITQVMAKAIRFTAHNKRTGLRGAFNTKISRTSGYFCERTRWP